MAILVSLEDQLIFVLEALEGSISWVNVPVVPSSKLNISGSIVIPVTDTSGACSIRSINTTQSSDGLLGGIPSDREAPASISKILPERKLPPLLGSNHFKV